MGLKKFLSTGNYSAKQFDPANPLISWSHTRRFRHARRLIKGLSGARLLDYGCGDGTFLALNQDLFPEAFGFDGSRNQLEKNRTRFSNIKSIGFLNESELTRQKFSVITCMEVLEHCIDRETTRVIDDLHRLLDQNGKLLISVPVETGPPLIIKQLGRRTAAFFNLGDYKHMESYKLLELLEALLATSDSKLARPCYEQNEASGLTRQYHGHKGFNWRALEKKLQVRFQIEYRSFSPVSTLGPFMSSQVFFLCKAR